MKPSDFPSPGTPRWMEWRASGMRIEDWIREHPGAPSRVVSATSPPDLPGQRIMPFAPRIDPGSTSQALGPVFEEKAPPRPGAIWPENPDSDVWPEGRE